VHVTIVENLWFGKEKKKMLFLCIQNYSLVCYLSYIHIYIQVHTRCLVNQSSN